jgi:hypothetical protein
MKKLICLALILAPIFCVAQFKKNAFLVGGRGGISSGLTVNKILSPVFASETIIATRFKGITATTLIEASYRVERSNLYLFGGAGMHVSSINGKEVALYRDEENHNSPGVDVIFGVDYFFEKMPINFSIDCKPSFSLVNHKMKFMDGAAFSLRYSFR